MPTVEVMPTPGAEMSGLMRVVPAAGPVPSSSSQATGPRPEKGATTLPVSMAPTASDSG